MLAKFGYQQSVQFFPALYGNFFDVSNKLPTNPVVHELRMMGFARAAAYIDEFRPDAVISTFPVAGGVVSDIKADRPLIVGDGHHRLRRAPGVAPPGDRLLLRGVQGGPRGPGGAGHPWDRVVVSGIPVAEKFTEQFDRAALRRELGLADRFTALLTAAAGLPGDAARHRQAARRAGASRSRPSPATTRG